jgi:hypothetical protein
MGRVGFKFPVTAFIRTWLQFLPSCRPDLAEFLGRTPFQASAEYLDDDSYGNP